MMHNHNARTSIAELLARFLRHKSFFSSKFMRVKAEAFDPPRPNFDLSVTRHAGRTNTELWTDRQYIECHGSHVYARADFDASLLPGLGLKLIPSPMNTPVGMYQNHADIVGWTQDDLKKSEEMSKMNTLALNSILLFP